MEARFLISPHGPISPLHCRPEAQRSRIPCRLLPRDSALWQLEDTAAMTCSTSAEEYFQTVLRQIRCTAMSATKSQCECVNNVGYRTRKTEAQTDERTLTSFAYPGTEEMRRRSPVHTTICLCFSQLRNSGDALICSSGTHQFGCLTKDLIVKPIPAVKVRKFHLVHLVHRHV